MNIDTGSTVSPLCHHTGNDRRSQFVQFMRDPLNRNYFDERIRKNNFLIADCSGISFIRRFDIRHQQLAYRRKRRAKFVEYRYCAPGWSIRSANPDTLTNLILQPDSNTGKPIARQSKQRSMMNRIIVVEPRKKNLQQIFADLTDSPLGGHVVRISIVQTAQPLVRSEQSRDKSIKGLFHLQVISF